MEPGQRASACRAESSPEALAGAQPEEATRGTRAAFPPAARHSPPREARGGSRAEPSGEDRRGRRTFGTGRPAAAELERFSEESFPRSSWG